MHMDIANTTPTGKFNTPTRTEVDYSVEVCVCVFGYSSSKVIFFLIQVERYFLPGVGNFLRFWDSNTVKF